MSHNVIFRGGSRLAHPGRSVRPHEEPTRSSCRTQHGGSSSRPDSSVLPGPPERRSGLLTVRQATHRDCTSGLATDCHISHTQSPSRLHGFVLSWTRTAAGPKGYGMVQGNVTDGDVAELIRSTADAASAYIRGDIRRYLTLIKHGDDYTLMAPYGGEPRRGFNAEEALESTPKMFRGGEADLELVETYTSGDMAVLVAIERQHGEVGGMPDQDWSLRVTLVFRHEGSEWRLVHRHADPLVHAISMERMAALARGQS